MRSREQNLSMDIHVLRAFKPAFPIPRLLVFVYTSVLLFPVDRDIYSSLYIVLFDGNHTLPNLAQDSNH
jgi:hypothetical protein